MRFLIFPLCYQVYLLRLGKEMFTVSSLANVLLTLVRRELVFDNGIPLGMLYSSTRFTQVTYLISPTLWSCVKFPGSWMKRGFLIAMILIAGLLAIFAGPATATLLLPEVRPDWPAGGTAFWLRGKAEDLWPTKLGADHVGGPECVAPGEEFIKLAPFNLTHCIWYSSAAFSDSFRRSDLVPEFDLPVKDDLSRRTVHISKESDVGPAGTIETWALSTYAIIAYHSWQLRDPWWKSAYWTTRPDHHTIKIWYTRLGSFKSQLIDTRCPCQVRVASSTRYQRCC